MVGPKARGKATRTLYHSYIDHATRRGSPPLSMRGFELQQHGNVGSATHSFNWKSAWSDLFIADSKDTATMCMVVHSFEAR